MGKPSSKSTSWSGLMIILVIMTIVVNGHEEDEVWEAQVQPRKGWNSYTRACLRKLTHECADQLYHYIFNQRQTQDIFINCCNRMVKMGELCNRALSDTISRRHAYRRWRGHIYQRSLEGYRDCLRRV